jgi:hypothetical protein
MTDSQRLVIGRAARIVRDTYCFQGDPSAVAVDKTLAVFASVLDDDRAPRTLDIPDIGPVVDAAGVVALALGSIGHEKPDAMTAETILATARAALEGGNRR